MRLILVTGGARSGKSRYAQRRAQDWGAQCVTFVATAAITDEEMARRAARHRAERPAAWMTVEAPRDAGRAVREAATDTVLLDCLTLLLANVLSAAHPRGEDDALAAMGREVDGLLAAAAARAGHLIVVTNEVGLGVHPPTALGRWFRDGLGLANQRVAAVAEEVILMVSGQVLRVK